MTAAFRSYGLSSSQFIDDPVTNNFIEQNLGPDRKIFSQLDTPDALNRYQEQLLNSRRPEKHVQEDYEDGEMATRARGRYRMNLMEFGNELGDTDQAYKPEIVTDPVPTRTFADNPYNQYRKEREISKVQAKWGTAQKESLLNFVNTDPRYKHSDSYKYIPGEIRTMPKIEIADYLVPSRKRAQVVKGIHTFKNSISDVKEKITDPNKSNRKSTSVKARRGHGVRQQLDQSHVVQGGDGVNDGLYSTATKKKSAARLPQDIPIIDDESHETDRGRKRENPKFGNRPIHAGSIVDIIHDVETVQSITSQLKKNQLRPNLGLKTLIPEMISDTITDIFKSKLITPGRPRTFINPQQETADYSDESSLQNPNLKDHNQRGPIKRHIHISKQLIRPDDTNTNPGFVKKIRPNYVQSRNFIVGVYGDDTVINDNHIRTKIVGKKDLSFKTSGLEIEDSDVILGQIQPRKKLGNNSMVLRYEEVQPDLTSVMEVQPIVEKNTKARVSRKLPVGTISVDADPYNETKKSLVHPKLLKEKYRNQDKQTEKLMAVVKSRDIRS
jgi:hypothetical protein